ncbi:MAG: hypothetical protein RBT76_03085 [candidate division Zixibacteria bacterium]|jgi:uncharacterized membrane protein|nr:hypothetical protein [candidate division Zixibacteria bacterium]
MMQDVLITGIIFFAFSYIIKILADARTRNRLIEKGLVDKNVQHLFTPNRELQALSSLKWGMVLVGIGLAALLSQLFPYDVTAEVAVGLTFVFAGLAFLIYYPLATSRLRRLEAENRAAQAGGSDSM